MLEIQLVNPKDVKPGQEIRLTYIPAPREVVVTGKVRQVDVHGIEVEHPGGGGYTFIPWQADRLTVAVLNADSTKGENSE